MNEAIERAFSVWQIEGMILFVCYLAVLLAAWCFYGPERFFEVPLDKDKDAKKKDRAND